jgi:hypothetical protein
MHYTDDLIILDLTFIEGRSKETRLALLKDINTRVAAAARASPDDLMITLYEAPGEEFLLWPGRGAAGQRRSARDAAESKIHIAAGRRSWGRQTNQAAVRHHRAQSPHRLSKQAPGGATGGALSRIFR